MAGIAWQILSNADAQAIMYADIALTDDIEAPRAKLLTHAADVRIGYVDDVLVKRVYLVRAKHGDSLQAHWDMMHVQDKQLIVVSLQTTAEPTARDMVAAILQTGGIA